VRRQRSQHPYSTQLLIGSVRYQSRPRVAARCVVVGEIDEIIRSRPVAASSPTAAHVMDKCAQPPLFRTAPKRVAACFRYDHAPRCQRRPQ
jgi:hypothetical protein